MLSKNQVKYVTSLAVKKFRNQHGLFIAEGVKLVTELLRSPIAIKQLFATKEFLSGINEKLFTSHPGITEVTETELQKISQLTTANQALAIAEIPIYELDLEAVQTGLALVLDDVRDPGNLGTIIRIADWFGIGNVICSINSADAWNPKSVQATMGSIARVKVHYTDIVSLLDRARVPVYGAVLEGDNMYSSELAKAGFIVIGNESKGISPEVLHHVSHKIRIPSYSSGESGEAESLNAAIATAVICAEFRRRDVRM